MIPIVSIPMITYGTILVVILFTSLIALLRISRNFRRHFLADRPKPTETKDVWKMHRLPDDGGEDLDSDAARKSP